MTSLQVKPYCYIYLRLDSFYRNQQYLVTLTEPDEVRKDGKCALVVSLIQESDRPDNESNIACSFTALEVQTVLPPPPR